jgi:serine/threonine-protein kinase
VSPALKESKTIPRKVGVYRLKELIGSGAMGKVYRATHETLGKDVALKLLHVEDEDSENQQRFVQEGIAASRVRHPNVVEIFDAGTEGATTYLAMQLLEGETLAQCLSRQGRLPLTTAIDLILPVCAALVSAHGSGVLHRDLKPANIFLSDVGRGEPEPILLDFGISKILGPVDAALTQNPRFLGTPFYIAPEQADGETATPLSDQYSLALTLYEILLGVRPFERYRNSLVQLLRHVAEGDIRPPQELDESISDDLDEAICRALNPNPEERFPSVREFGAALLPYASAARRTLWEHSFIDAERTMNSVNAPVSDARSSKKVAVELSGKPSLPRPDETVVDRERQREEFLTHSLLFGSPPQQEDGAEFDPEKSSIGRRSFPPDDVKTDPYSGRPSSRATGRWDSAPRTTQPDPSNTSIFGAPASSRKSHNSPRSRRHTILGVSGVLALGAIVGLGSWLLMETTQRKAPVYNVEVEVIPSSAELRIDGTLAGTGSFKGQFEKDGKPHHLVAEAPSYASATILFTDQAPPKLITLRALTEPKSSPATDSEEMVDEPSSTPDETAAPKPVSEKPPHTPRTKAPKSPQAPQEHPTLAASVAPEPSPSELASPPPAETAPPKEEQKDRTAIPTGNLDPWAQ